MASEAVALHGAGVSGYRDAPWRICTFCGWKTPYVPGHPQNCVHCKRHESLIPPKHLRFRYP